MRKAEKRTKIALDESRTLMLGAQILLGFQFHGPFQNAFDALPHYAKVAYLGAIAAMVVVVGLLITPSAYHRIVERGDAGAAIDRLITQVAALTLLPFAVALSLDLFVAGSAMQGLLTAGAMAGAGLIAAIGFWYGPNIFNRGRPEHDDEEESSKASTEAKIELVLTESRVVLPGAQALLGFQLAIVLTDGFAQLPGHAKLLHGAALGCIALATILLVTPAAYHRIVYAGAMVEAFYKIASRFVLSATVFLALGLSADIDVIVAKITGMPLAAGIAAGSAFIVLVGLWHIWPLSRRRARKAGRSE
ncbi:MAG: hypothetical protein E5W82_33090 [Mesorhizobium sp.]|nr:MAG: hypothetical protein E5W82_33090 [Mesorhizobium sp.]TJW40121.1 MAG: hypothetical protein E5W83_29275 [Mesorhizobium sp.]